MLSDLKEADFVTYNLTRKILDAKSSEEFVEVVNSLGHISEASEEVDLSAPDASQKILTFIYTTLNGEQVELVPEGKEAVVE